MESKWCEECQRLRWLALINDSVLIQHRHNLLPWRAYFKCLELMVCIERLEREEEVRSLIYTDTHRQRHTATHTSRIHTHTHTPDVFLLSGHHSYSYSSLTRRAVLVLDREQRSCQQARSLSRSRLPRYTATHTCWYKHRAIHAAETCHAARLRWLNTHKHTWMGRGVKRRVKQHGLCDPTVTHNEQCERYGWTHKHTHTHTHTQAETNTQTVRPGKSLQR